jgi:hypothetical protein
MLPAGSVPADIVAVVDAPLTIAKSVNVFRLSEYCKSALN